MAGDRIRLEVKDREERGSRASRRLRGEGLVPGVLYGAGKEARPFTVPERELRRALSGGHGLHAILDVVLQGQQRPHHAVLKDYQLDPTKARLLHVDFHEVRLDQVIHMSIGVELVGTAEGVSRGGVLTQLVREVNVEALPMEVPDHLTLDVSGLAIGDNARVAEVAVPAGVTVLDDPEAVVASVLAPTRIEELEEAVVAVEAEAAAEAPVEEAAEAVLVEDRDAELLRLRQLGRAGRLADDDVVGLLRHAARRLAAAGLDRLLGRLA